MKLVKFDVILFVGQFEKIPSKDKIYQVFGLVNPIKNSLKRINKLYYEF
jgi:hypothetical protein